MAIDWEDEDPCAPDADDSEEDEDEDSDEPDEAECRQKRFKILTLAAGAGLAAVIAKYLQGTQSALVTELGFKQLLADAHAKAAALGRQKAGDGAGLTVDDRLLGERIAENEGKYLARFIEDLENGRYTDNEEAARRRAFMYTDLIRGTANHAFVAASNPDDIFQWMLGENENHCEDEDGMDCPSIAAGGANGDGVYPASELPTTPGEGDTPCLGNCECDIVRADGVSGFRRVRDEDE